MSLRETVEDTVWQYGEFRSVENTPEERTDHAVIDSGEATSTIIAAMRDALLSEAAVEAARDAIEAEVYAASLPGGRYSEKSLARAALTAALAAMTAGDTD